MKYFKKLHLSKDTNQHLYIQLYNYIKLLIKKGEIPYQTKLPPIRGLSKFLGINNVTVVNAYKLLEQEGYVYKKTGSGTFVNYLNNEGLSSIVLDDEITHVYEESNINTKYQKHNVNDFINFSSTAPTPDLFPIDDFKHVLNKVLDRDKGNAFVYQESQGYYPLRKTINENIKNTKIDANVNNIQIVSGAQQGIDIISKSLLDYGDIVFTESPTYTGALAAFKSRDAKILEIPMETDGLDLSILENKLTKFKPKVLYLMPNYQNPTGYSYSYDKKLKILKLADKFNVFIIEDDYLSDLSFNSSKNVTMKSMDAYNRVIYIKSFSKIFMPGLRLAFMIIPELLYNDVLSAKHTSDISTSGLMQRAFDLYLKTGQWEKHIKNMEYMYKERFNITIKNINKYIPDNVDYHLPKGGLNFWFSLPNGYSSNELYKLCLKNNILIVPGRFFFSDEKDNHFFRISIASIDTKHIEASIKKLSDVIVEFLNKGKEKNNSIGLYPPFI